MDQIKKDKLNKAAIAFIASIDQARVCALASSFHPKKWTCRIFGDVTKGSYNACFPIVFLDAEGNEAEKWIVRIPLLPRLAFPEEKMRSEIATMKYISEKTKIPIPRIHGYSITNNNALRLPFLLLEYIDGKTLHSMGSMKDMPQEQRVYIYQQLSFLYLELFQQQFDRIGALTLDENDEHWTFGHNRPLTITDNDQVVGGLDACQGPYQTFTSTIDYIYAIRKIIFNDFYFVRDSVFDEDDARCYLYSLYASQGILMEWVDPEYNHGPFILMHGDLRPPNIILDDKLNVISVLDWEWSHTIPAQLFVPPSWLTGEELISASKDLGRILLMAHANQLEMELTTKEFFGYNPNRRRHADLPLTKLWRRAMKHKNLFVAHALLKPCYFGNVYFNALDYEYYGENLRERVESFFKLDCRQPARDAIRQKMREMEDFGKELESLNLEREKPFEQSALGSETLRKMREFRLERAALREKAAQPKPKIASTSQQLSSQPAKLEDRKTVYRAVMQWSLISLGVALVSCSILTRRRL
ncbi:hypothetical protein PRK78_002487 [Emydomyces testavorans]|uniref:Aminoglycoside phosphotransferase domain-containing protein n=1 Tax=Emydomyces testavorans TaxID=2070801 RepID=A0AAF0IHL8_9EURO|nr:hypothetical protein PRK78_002487 [Emydomyces testavorans]